MLEFLNNIAKLTASLFGANVPEEGAWDRIPPELMSPRERLLRRSSLIMFLGAIVNLLAAVVVIAIAISAATNDHSRFAATRDILLSNFLISDDAAVLLIIVGILGNMAILLVLAVVILAQELWTVFTAWLLAALNVAALFLFGFLPALLAIVPLTVVGLMTFGDLRAFRLNPVMVKELRGRMRGVRGFAIITVFLTLMSFFTMLLYLLRVPQGGVVVTGELGRLLFIGILFIELMLIIFIVPALTAGAITSERERKTYDLLQTTLITKATFVVGKMQSALGYILLLLLSAIPLAKHRLSIWRGQRIGVDPGAAGACGLGGDAGRFWHVLLVHHRAHIVRHRTLLHRGAGHYNRFAGGRADTLSGRLWQRGQQYRSQDQQQPHRRSGDHLPRYGRHQPQPHHSDHLFPANADRPSATDHYARHLVEQWRDHSDFVALGSIDALLPVDHGAAGFDLRAPHGAPGGIARRSANVILHEEQRLIRQAIGKSVKWYRVD